MCTVAPNTQELCYHRMSDNALARQELCWPRSSTQSQRDEDLLQHLTDRELKQLYDVETISCSINVTIPTLLNFSMTWVTHATVLHNFEQVLRYILPDKCLRPRRHELTLTTKYDSRNFFDYYLKIHIRPNVAFLLTTYCMVAFCLPFFSD